MSNIELFRSNNADAGHIKYIIFDHADNSIKGVINLDNTPIVTQVEECYKFTFSNGKTIYITKDELLDNSTLEGLHYDIQSQSR